MVKLDFTEQAKRMRESIREEMETWERSITKRHRSPTGRRQRSQNPNSDSSNLSGGTKITPKEVYKRLKFKESIQKKIKKAKSDIDKSYKKLYALQDSCPHYDSIYVNKGDTGSWDRDDSYWRDYECFDCGLRWQTEQSIEMEKKYPYAVNKTYK